VHYLQRLGHHLLVLGIPGLFLIALLDSAAIPMAGGPDAFIILLAWQRPAHFLWIAVTASFGSVIGCLILYRIALAGGTMVLTHISPERQEWVKQRIEGNAFWAVLLAVMAPPPFPTKPVILAAGVFRVPLTSFTFAVLLGRLVRYTAFAYLAARLGDQTASVIRSHYPIILLALAVIACLVLLSRKLQSKSGN
jgi:membrane protein YqaA with SNARE-associated domain